MVALGGGTILVIGFAMIVLPGPAVVVIPLGLGILATEFVWARRWFRRAKNLTHRHRTRRTTAALRTTLRRRWERWRLRLLRFRQSPARLVKDSPTTRFSETVARTAKKEAGADRRRSRRPARDAA